MKVVDLFGVPCFVLNHFPFNPYMPEVPQIYLTKIEHLGKYWDESFRFIWDSVFRFETFSF